MKLVEAAGRNDQLMTTPNVGAVVKSHNHPRTLRRHEKAPALSHLHADDMNAEMESETDQISNSYGFPASNNDTDRREIPM